MMQAGDKGYPVSCCPKLACGRILARRMSISSIEERNRAVTEQQLMGDGNVVSKLIALIGRHSRYVGKFQRSPAQCSSLQEL